jgi:hypothetical protein
MLHSNKSVFQETRFKNIEIFLRIKFHGSLEELQEIVLRCAIPGGWHFHKKSRFYKFEAATGAILNWWPSTGTINFQGQDAEEFETLFLEHAFVGVAQSDPALVCEESVWAAVHGPTPPLEDLREAVGSAGAENRRKLASRVPQRLDSRSVKLLPAPDRG